MSPDGMAARPWIVILTWNGSERLPFSLGSMAQLQGDFDVLVVDNGSRDDSVASAARVLPRAHILRNQENLGFAEGNNHGIAYALARGASHVALVNDDMRLAPDWLAALLRDEAAHPEAGVRGGLVLFEDRPDVVNSTGIVIDSLFRARDRDFGRRRTEAIRSSAEAVVAVTGGAMLISRRVLERIGGFDAAFFAYYEDLDFCLRARRQGFEVRFVPAAVSYHQFAGSLGPQHPHRRYLLARNQMIMVGRYVPAPKSVLLLLGIALYRILLKLPAAMIRGRPRIGIAEAQAVTAGMPAGIREILSRGAARRTGLPMAKST